MDSDAMKVSELSLRELLLRYRRHLPPGAYYYFGKDDVAQSTGIVEVYAPHGGESHKRENKVSFCFFEKGYPPPDLAVKDFRHWLHLYPFSHSIASTSSEFQEKLASFVQARLRKISAQGGALDDADLKRSHGHFPAHQKRSAH